MSALPPDTPPPAAPSVPPPPRSLLVVLFSLGAGILLGLIGATLCCLFGLSLLDRLHLFGPVFMVGAGVLVVAPLLLLLYRRPKAPFVVGLIVGLSLTGLLMGACGTLMR